MSHEADSRDEKSTDRETALILDYLANQLDARGARAVERRASRDRAFRHKISDVALLKGIVMMALERDARPRTGCARVRRLLPRYLAGMTTASETGVLSRHLDGCTDCEDELTVLQEAGVSPRISFWRRALARIQRWLGWRRDPDAV